MNASSKKILAYAMMAAVIALSYLVASFAVDLVFRLCGNEDVTNPISTAICCVVITGAIVAVEFIRNKQKGIDRSNDLITKCRKVLVTTTIMFLGFMIMDWLFMHFTGKDNVLGPKYWLPFSLGVAIVDLFYEKRREQKQNEDENAFVVAAECPDVQNAETICNKLEENGIKAMVVKKDSPVYIKGADASATAQVQVCSKDLNKAQELTK